MLMMKLLRTQISTQDRTHANKQRNEHTNADTKAHKKAHTSARPTKLLRNGNETKKKGEAGGAARRDRIRPVNRFPNPGEWFFWSVGQDRAL